MRIDILSLFPAMFAGPFGESITKRAVAKGILDVFFDVGKAAEIPTYENTVS